MDSKSPSEHRTEPAASLSVQVVSGAALEAYLPDLARLRIEVFREYPYLYDGSLDYESAYLRAYAESPDSCFVLALDGGRVVGVSTAVPLAHEGEAIKRPFIEASIDVESVFYYGESVLSRSYRGKGLGWAFMRERERHARALGRFDCCAFCAVQRPADHPRRPAGYQPLDAFWERAGFVNRPDLSTHFSWKEIGEASESPKPMGFWLKAL